jgi:hypothetical protein
MPLHGWLTRFMPWLTRGHRHEFEVIKSFSARSAISNEERIFNPGEKVICEQPAAQAVMLETRGAFFFADPAVFASSCKAIQPGS